MIKAMSIFSTNMKNAKDARMAGIRQAREEFNDRREVRLVSFGNMLTPVTIQYKINLKRTHKTKNQINKILK